MQRIARPFARAAAVTARRSAAVHRTVASAPLRTPLTSTAVSQRRAMTSTAARLCASAPEPRHSVLPAFAAPFHTSPTFAAGGSSSRGEMSAEDAKVAIKADPKNPAALRTLVGEALMHADPTADASVSPLDITVEVNGETRTAAEWLTHLISVEEYNAASWEMAHDIVSTVREVALQLIARGLHNEMEPRMAAVTSPDEAQRIQTEFQAKMHAAMRETPRPSITIGGVEYSSVMCLARVYEIRQREALAFGPSREGDDKAREKAVATTLSLLAFNLEGDELTVTRAVGNTSDPATWATVPHVITELTACTESLAIDGSNAELWRCAAVTAGAQSIPSVSIGPEEFAPSQLAARACELNPLDSVNWQALMTTMVEEVKATGVTSDAELQAKLERTGAMINGDTVPAGAVFYFCENAPKDRDAYYHTLHDIIEDGAPKA